MVQLHNTKKPLSVYVQTHKDWASVMNLPTALIDCLLSVILYEGGKCLCLCLYCNLRLKWFTVDGAG